MRQYTMVLVAVIFMMQLTIAQDYSKVNKIAVELKKTLNSFSVNETKNDPGENVLFAKNGNEEQQVVSKQPVDSMKTVPEKSMNDGACTSMNTQVKFGVDLYSRYIWRGLDYGNAPSIQPAISYTIGGLSVGTWAAYSVGVSSVDSFGVGNVFAEHDLWASYSVPVEAGTISLYYTDYYYPSSGLKYFNFGSNGGSHVLEFGAGFTGNENIPLTINAYYNFHNDPDNSIYVQCGYLYSAESYSANLFAAFTPAASVWYGTSKADLINLGVTVSKPITVSEQLSIPLTVSFIMNPHIEQTYLIVGISL